MSDKTKQQHTPGPWHVEAIDAYDGDGPSLFGVCHPETVCAATTVCNVFSTADAHLIAEAGTAKHETGLTPRQLAEQRAELLAALKEVIAWVPGQASWHTDGAAKAVAQARAAIAKATNTKPASDGTLTIHKAQPVNHEEQLAEQATQHEEWMEEFAGLHV